MGDRLRELREEWESTRDLDAHGRYLEERLRLGALDPLNDYSGGADIDRLTGLYGRSFILERLRAALSSGASVALLLIDVDHCKSLNDRHGHQVTDAVLSRLGRLLPACVASSTDTVGRYGGDEYLIVLLDGSAARAEVTAARVRGVVRQEVNAEEVHVTVSIGLAASRGPEDPPDPQALFELAEEGLHQAKGSGRDRWAWGRP